MGSAHRWPWEGTAAVDGSDLGNAEVPALRHDKGALLSSPTSCVTCKEAYLLWVFAPCDVVDAAFLLLVPHACCKNVSVHIAAAGTR